MITQVNGGSGSGAITGVELITAGTYQGYSPVLPGDQTYFIPRFTGSVSGNTLTLDSYTSGTDAPYAYGFNLAVGQTVTDASTGTSLGTITALATGNGGIGSTYTLSQTVSSPIAADSMTAQTVTTFTGSIKNNVLTVPLPPSGSPLVVGDTFYAPGVPVGTAITAQLTGIPKGSTGGAGTYQLATLTGASLNVSSESMTAQLNQTLTTASGAQLPIESNMLSPALTQPTAVDSSDQGGTASDFGSGLGNELTTAYEMTSAHAYNVAFTGDTTSGSNQILNVVNNSPAHTPLIVGMAVDGPGIPAGDIITAISGGGSTLTLSQAATVGAGAGSSMQAWNEWTSAIDPNTIAAGGSGYANGETVVALGGVTAAAGAPLLGTVFTTGGVVTGFVASDAINNSFQGDAGTSNNWYSVLPTVPCPVTGGTGRGALFNLTMNDVESGATGIAIATVVSGHGGSGYVVGDVLTLSAPAGVTPSGTAATLTVTAVSGTGAITGVNVKTAGSYSKDNPATLFYVAPLPGGSSGSGCILSWQALQTSVPDNASSSRSPDAAIANCGGYAVGDVLAVTGPSSFKDSNGNTATWTVAPVLQVTHYTYSPSGASFTYKIINTPKTSTGVAPSSAVTFNVFPLGYTLNTTTVGPNTYYGAGVNGGVAEFAAGATLNFGPQQFGGTPGSVIQEGSGTTIVTGANTYSGGTTLSAGTLAVANNAALGTGTLTVTGGTLEARGRAITLTNAVSLAGNATIGGRQALTLGGPITLTASQTLTVTNTATTTFTGAVGQSGATNFGLTKAGSGTLVLAADNTYKGSTFVTGGTLLVNDSIAGAVTVQNHGTLGGSGKTVAVTVQSGGTLIPGSSATQPAILNAASLTLSSGSSFDVALNSTTAGSGYSQLIVAGEVRLGGSTLNVSLGYTPLIGDSFTIIKNDDGDAVSGTFSGLAEGATFVKNGMTFKITYKGGSGHDVVITRVA
jgi:autotransporter-associated beta strand protein